MVNPFGEPVLADQGEVEIPGVDGAASGVDHAHRAIVEGNAGDSRRSADAFLPSAITDVDQVIVHRDVDAPERADRVDDEDLVPLTHELTDVLERLCDSRGGLAMHDGHHLGVGVGIESGRDLIGTHDLAQGDLDSLGRAAVPFDDFGQPLAEETVDPHHHLVAGLDNVANGGLHPGHPRARKREGEFVVGLKEKA